MTSLDPTAGIPGDSLADYHTDLKVFSVNEINDTKKRKMPRYTPLAHGWPC